MHNVIEMPLPKYDLGKAPVIDGVMYVYGKTLRSLEREMGGNPEHLFDTDGTPVLEAEYYEITSAGIRRL